MAVKILCWPMKVGNSCGGRAALAWYRRIRHVLKEKKNRKALVGGFQKALVRLECFLPKESRFLVASRHHNISFKASKEAFVSKTGSRKKIYTGHRSKYDVMSVYPFLRKRSSVIGSNRARRANEWQRLVANIEDLALA